MAFVELNISIVITVCNVEFCKSAQKSTICVNKSLHYGELNKEFFFYRMNTHAKSRWIWYDHSNEICANISLTTNKCFFGLFALPLKHQFDLYFFFSFKWIIIACLCGFEYKRDWNCDCDCDCNCNCDCDIHIELIPLGIYGWQFRKN